ncbi:MAG: lysoplasmalogenase [bacterium]|nr:MAG: lysoplasmalogenase [bacterium]
MFKQLLLLLPIIYFKERYVMLVYYLIIALLTLFVILLIRAELAGNQKQIYLFKPLSTTLVIIVAALSIFVPDKYNLSYTLAIILGLLFSFSGDVVLMFKSKRAFMIGLILFLIAHVVYSIVFTVYSGFVKRDLISAVVLILLAIIIYFYLYPGLEKMKIPVFVYIIVISLMMNRAISTFSGKFFNYSQALLISIGAALFYISDLILAINKFRKPFKYHRINLAFYYSGQLLIALSTGFFIY